jgi:hemolysin activation/secretion protein
MRFYIARIAIAVFLSGISSKLAALEPLQGPADAGRVETRPPMQLPKYLLPGLVIPEPKSQLDLPPEFKMLRFRLKSVKLEGAKAIPEAELAAIYGEDINQSIPLSRMWEIAEKISQHYQQKGYFLSRAYVPAQELDMEGSFTIHVVEGYIGRITIDPELPRQDLFKALITPLILKTPIDAQTIETFMLRMNDLPGYSFFGTLRALPEGEEGAVELRIEHKPKEAQGSVTINNYGSVFLGPNQQRVTYQDAIVPLQQTTVSVSSTLPAREMKYASIIQEVPLAPAWKLELAADYVSAHPGDALKPNDINSTSTSKSVGVHYQLLRERDENVSITAKIEHKNVASNFLGTSPLTRDWLRVLRGGVAYDVADRWGGQNVVTLDISRGLKMWGASEAGEQNLSRIDATPHFTKLEFSALRQQPLDTDFTLTGRLRGQWSSRPLYSSEQIGFGGPAMGRAYDASEITGDHGINGSLEMRHQGWALAEALRLSPYIFAELGKVWKINSERGDNAAASVGFGSQWSIASRATMDIALALPVSRPAANPTYGNGRNPRILAQITVAF